MANVLVSETSLQDIASAIRAKNGTQTRYKPAQMGEAIRAISGGGGITPTGTKTITANGTHDVAAYANVDVNVPNSYAASDEGKVVNNGALVAQTSQTVTANGTYDTTLKNEMVVNVPSGWSPEEVGTGTYANNKAVTYTANSIGVAAFLGSNITSFYAPNCTAIDTTATGGTISSSEVVVFQRCTKLTSIDMPVLTAPRDYFAPYCTSLVSVNLPLATYVGAQDFYGCSSLPGFVGKNVGIVYTSAFNSCSNLAYLDIKGANTATGFRTNALNGCSKLNVLIIRGTGAVQKLENTNVFTNTPFASGKAGGTLYVPSALISSYQSATNWSTILGYETNNIVAIEGSQYENYYADGTPIPTT